MMIYALYISFLKYPPFHCKTDDSLLWLLVEKFNQSFSLGFQMASPIIIMVLTFNVSLALVARIMPQMNVFFVAISIQLSIVLLFFALTVPYMMEIMYDTLKGEIHLLVKFLSPP